MSAISTRQAWLGWAGSVLLLLVLFRETGQSMADIWWRSETFAHGMVVPFISGWLIWRERARLVALPIQPSGLALCLFMAVAGGWLLGALTWTNAVAQLALATLIVLTVPVLLGWRVAQALWFPLLFLYFAVPIGEFLIPWLMQRTADFTVSALLLSGVPVYREGLQFVIPTGNWSVVEACSGIRYLIASLMVGTLYGYLSFVTWKRRLAFFALSLGVPLLANWVRAYLIVIIGHLSGNKLATGVDHLIYGWVFFGVVMFLMFTLGGRWAESEVQPVKRESSMGQSTTASRRRYTTVLLGLCVVIMVSPWVLQSFRATGPTGTPVLSAPSLAGWERGEALDAAWQPLSIHPAAEAQWTYRAASGAPEAVALYVAYYRHQTAQAKLISSDNVLVHSSDTHWAQIALETRAVPNIGSVDRALIRPIGPGGVALSGGRVVWRLYVVDGQWTNQGGRAKLLTAGQQLRGHGDDGALLVLSVPLGQEPGEAETPAAADERLTRFLQSQQPALTQWLAEQARVTQATSSDKDGN